MDKKPILVTGGTGFLGGQLISSLLSKQWPVSVFSRSEQTVRRKFGAKVSAYTRLEQLPGAGEFSAIVNLAGAGIFDSLWTAKRKNILRNSRIELTRGLVDWLRNSAQKPALLISGSAIGYYGDQGEQLLTEQSPAVSDFAHLLCRDWEAEAQQAADIGVRVCIIRTGLVLGEGGLLKRMLPAYRLGLGGVFGGGQQWMSWIHWRDWVSIAEAMIGQPDMQGVYNATAPHPVTNRRFTLALAGALHKTVRMPPLPAWLLRALMGEMADLLLASQRVSPERMLERGYSFLYPELDTALNDILTGHAGNVNL
ncbi:MAG: TIGR01777 family oxidoreductase [Methylomonas sp.]|jgi:uncharacterized protein (TIGR01777 family)